MNTFMLIHITDTDRFLTTDTPELLVNFAMTAGGKAKFMLEGTIYEVCDVVYNFASPTQTSTGDRLLSLLTALTGSEESAARLLERSESLNGIQGEVRVMRNDDGTINALIQPSFNEAVCVAQAAPLRVLEESLFGGDHWAPSTDGAGMTVSGGNSGPRDC